MYHPVGPGVAQGLGPALTGVTHNVEVKKMPGKSMVLLNDSGLPRTGSGILSEGEEHFEKACRGRLWLHFKKTS